MNVSIDTYRQTIGRFQQCDMKPRTENGKLKYSNQFLNDYLCSLTNERDKRTNKGDFFRCLVLYSILFCVVLNVKCAENNSEARCKLFVHKMKNIATNQNEEQIQAVLKWSYSMSTNKLNHILYGNRRNIGYKYFTWNCDRGLIGQNKIEDLRVFAAKHKPHFISINEIDLRRNESNRIENRTNELSTEQVLDKLKIEGYRIILPQSCEKHNKARIIVFADEEMNVKMKTPDEEENHLQNILLEIGFGKSKKHLVNFYYREWKSCVTGKGTSADQFHDLSLLMNIWRRSTSKNQEFLALGDMNLCALKWDESGYSYRAMADLVQDFMLEENCYQLMNKHTRIRQVKGEIQRSCLDHVTVNCVDKMSNIDLHGVEISDHMGILVTKNSREVRSHPKTTRKRVYKEFDKEAFKNEIKEAKKSGAFKEMFETEDIEVAGDIFTIEFLRVLDKHAPLKVIQNRNGYVPYISKELKEEMDIRDVLKKEAASTGSNYIYDAYKMKRNEVSTKGKEAKANYYKQKFDDKEMTSSDMWKTAYQILGNNVSSFPSQMMFSGKLFSKPIEIANEMNKFFVNKISKLKKKDDVDPTEALKGLKNFMNDKHIPEAGFQLKELNYEDMLKLIKTLKGKKSSGMDWICGYSLKVASKEIIPELKQLINLSIKTGKFFSKWKYAKVLPGFKNKGNKFEAQFYRPISNLSEVSKLTERAVYNQIYMYLLDNGLFHPDHHGCHKNHSTATALQQLRDLWLQAAEEGKLSAALMLDLRAGFDVVSHSLLLLKLKEYGLNDVALSWFSNYLTDRYQCVQIESALSSNILVPWGVPQGSILGPLLFLIFLNELPDIIKREVSEEGNDKNEATDGSIVIFVDDNTPTVSDSDPDRLLEKIQNMGDKVTDWFSFNDLTCSGEKTKLLVVGTRANRKAKLSNRDIRVTVCGDEVKESTSEKLLGITINNTLTWHHHLHGDDDNVGLLPTLAKRVGVLRKLRKYTPNNKFKQLVSGLFTSKLMFGATVWGGVWKIPGVLGESINLTSLTKQDMRKLQTLQNKVMRMESRMDYNTPTTTLLDKTNSLSVHQLVAQYMLTQMYKVVETQQPQYHYSRLVVEDMGGPARRSRKEVKIEFNLSLSRGSFFYQASRLWAALPAQLKQANKITGFKNLCKKWIKENILVKP